MDTLRRELIHRIETMPDAELAVLHAFFCGKPVENIHDSNYASISRTISSFLKSYAIGHSLDGYEYLRTALHIILENPSAYTDSIEAVYDIVGQEHDCPGPFVKLVIKNLILNVYQTYPKYFKDFPSEEPVPTSNEFLQFALNHLTK